MEFSTLSKQDLLLIARDTLRGRESDYYRISLLDEPNKEARLADMEETIEEIKKEISRLERRVGIDDEEIPVTDPDSPVPVEELSPQQKAARTRKENARKEEEEADGS
jgi:hypothetical protein